MVDNKEQVNVVDWDYDPFEEQRQKQVKIVKRKKRKRKILFNRIFAVVLLLGIIFAIYYYSDGAKVRSIVVKGNHFYTDKEIQEMAGIDYNSRFWLVGNIFADNKISDNPLIASTHIKHETNHTLVIEIEEVDCIGYFWASDGNSYILTREGKRIIVTAEYYGCFSRMPYIKNEKDVDRVVKSFAKVKADIITNISEIWTYTTTYDQNMFRVLMDDGNQLFGNEDSMELLNNYYGIMENLKNKNNYCLMFDKGSSTAYTRDCAEFDAEEKAAIEKINGQTPTTDDSDKKTEDQKG